MNYSPMLPVSVSTSEHNADYRSSNTATNIITRLTGSVRLTLSHCRPWAELMDRTAFAKPASFSDATSRLRKNLSYFKANYLTVLATVLAFSLISHPFSLLILLSLISAWLFLYVNRPSDQPLVVWGRTYSDGEKLAILVAVTFVVIFFTSVGSLLISGFVMGVAMVCAHGAFRISEDLFLDEQEALGWGLFSSVGGSASSAAAAAAFAAATAGGAPANASRV